VFDPSTGDFYVDEFGALVEVAPGLLVQTPDGRTLDGDDVANAAFLRGNVYEGECTRDVTVGVPYLRLALGTGDVDLAVSVVVAEVARRTPGVSGVVSVVSAGIGKDRVLRFAATILRQGGGDQAFNATTGG
jgi:hypothetical protein